MVISSNQLLLRSFGYGIFQAQMVPSELASLRRPPSNDDKIRVTKMLEKRVYESGIRNIQEVVPDPNDPELAYVLVQEGQSPCELERGQWQPADLDRLFMVVEASMKSRFLDRVIMLRVQGQSH